MPDKMDRAPSSQGHQFGPLQPLLQGVADIPQTPRIAGKNALWLQSFGNLQLATPSALQSLSLSLSQADRRQPRLPTNRIHAHSTYSASSMEIDWEPPLPAGYNDLHRSFLQNFMAQGTLTLKQGKKLLADLKSKSTFEPVDPDTITLDQFTDAIRTAREAVEPLDYDIRYMRDQVRDERVWVFYNTQSDPASQMATVHSAEEVAYIKRLLDAMFETYNTPRMEVMAVDEGQALKVSRPSRQSMGNGHVNGANGEDAEGSQSATRGLKHSEVLALLSNLVAEGWLEKSRDGFYSLSTRALVELWSWLVATYNDEEEEWQHIKFCEACKEIVTHGQRCNNVDCTIRLHDVCEGNFWRTRPDRKCPKCQTEWDGSQFVGERAITSRSAFQRSRAGRRGRRSEVAEDAGEEEAED